MLVLIAGGPLTLAIVLMGVVGIVFVCVVVVWSALAGTYKAVLYAYAIDGSVALGFESAQIERAFQKKAAAAGAPG